MNFESVFWDGVQQPRGHVDEACRLEQIEAGMPCPAYRFTVEERWTANQQPILRLAVVTEMDDPVQRYISQHPAFSKDFRPFVLWAVYDALWMLKLVEAGIFAPRRSIPSVSMASASARSASFAAPTSASFGQAKVPCSSRSNPLPSLTPLLHPTRKRRILHSKVGRKLRRRQTALLKLIQHCLPSLRRRP
jgi:hypothetical protein